MPLAVGADFTMQQISYGNLGVLLRPWKKK
jgi:hypothetical protein